jgi:hypothetical protein
MSQILLPANITSNLLINVSNNITPAPVFSLSPSTPLTEAERKFVLITSMMLSNTSLGSVTVNARVTNSNGSSAYLLHKVNIPAGTAFEVIQGNKFILKEGDSLYIWYEESTNLALDAIVSYVEHRPNTPYNS